jgi:hypothetical protein
MRKASGFIAPIALLVALAGCAGGQGTQVSGSTPGISRASTAAVACSQMGTKKFAKTRFLLHAGLGLGAFKKFVYDPFKAGKFKSGASGRVKSIVVAGAAALLPITNLSSPRASPRPTRRCASWWRRWTSSPGRCRRSAAGSSLARWMRPPSTGYRSRSRPLREALAAWQRRSRSARRRRSGSSPSPPGPPAPACLRTVSRNPAGRVRTRQGRSPGGRR